MPLFNTILILSLFLFNHIGAQLECEDDQFICESSGELQCIPEASRCDEVQHCDNLDEEDCPNTGGDDDPTTGEGDTSDTGEGNTSDTGEGDTSDTGTGEGDTSDTGTGEGDTSDTGTNEGDTSDTGTGEVDSNTEEPPEGDSNTAGTDGAVGDSDTGYDNYVPETTNGPTCFEDEFICMWKGKPLCTPNAWKCDGLIDCDSHYDEEDCGAPLSLPVGDSDAGADELNMEDIQENAAAKKSPAFIVTLVVILSIVLIAIVIGSVMCYLRRKRSTKFNDAALKTNAQMMQTKVVDMAEIS